MNTVSSTTVDIKKTLLHYIKAEFKEKDLDMLKSLLGSIYTELTNTPNILPHLENPNFAADPLDCCDRCSRSKFLTKLLKTFDKTFREIFPVFISTKRREKPSAFLTIIL